VDKSHKPEKGPSHGWVFFTAYNTEQAHTLLEVNASQRDKVHRRRQLEKS